MQKEAQFWKLNEAEILSIKRLRQKGLTYYDIAERIGISVRQVKHVLKSLGL